MENYKPAASFPRSTKQFGGSSAQMYFAQRTSDPGLMFSHPMSADCMART